METRYSQTRHSSIGPVVLPPRRPLKSRDCMNHYLHALGLLVAAWLAGFSPVGLAASSAPSPALHAFSHQYHARYLSFTGQGTLSLQQLEGVEGNRWRFTLQVRHPLASLAQSTVFEVVNAEARQVFRPLENVNESKIPFRHRRVTGHYDWNAGEATWGGDAKPGRRGPVALQPGDLDGLLVNLAVVRDLAQGQSLDYRMVDGGRAATLDYQITGIETLTVNGQPIQATRVERRYRNKQQLAWIAPGMPVPVRLLQREDRRPGTG